MAELNIFATLSVGLRRLGNRSSVYLAWFLKFLDWICDCTNGEYSFFPWPVRS